MANCRSTGARAREDGGAYPRSGRHHTRLDAVPVPAEPVRLGSRGPSGLPRAPHRGPDLDVRCRVRGIGGEPGELHGPTEAPTPDDSWDRGSGPTAVPHRGHPRVGRVCGSDPGPLIADDRRRVPCPDRYATDRRALERARESAGESEADPHCTGRRPRHGEPRPRRLWLHPGCPDIDPVMEVVPTAQSRSKAKAARPLPRRQEAHHRSVPSEHKPIAPPYTPQECEEFASLANAPAP